MQETQVLSLGQGGPLEKKVAIHSSILAWRIPWTRGAFGAAKSWTNSEQQISGYRGPLWGAPGRTEEKGA